MKIAGSWVALVILLIAGMLAMSSFLFRYEARNKKHAFHDKGASVVSLMALHPLEDFKEDRRQLMMRTVTENLSGEGFLYLFVHNLQGKEVFSLASGDISSRIPPPVVITALANKALTTQPYKPLGMETEVVEFSRPIVGKGGKTGTIRLGLKPLPLPLFSREGVTLVALMAYFIVAALILGYYGILLRLRLLKDISTNILEDSSPEAPARTQSADGNLQAVLNGMERSVQKVCHEVQKIKEENFVLISRLGVATFYRKHISSILDAMHFGIIITDIQDKVVFINRHMLSLIRKKREEALDHPLATVMAGPEIFSDGARQDSFARAKSSRPMEITLPDLPPGERFQANVSYLTDEGQELIGKIITIRDITASKMAEQSQHQFIAHVAHELLTPLTNIKSYSEMLMAGEVPNREMKREFYNTINAETGRLSRLIHTLLDLSKIEMGSLTLNRSLVRTDWFLEGSLAAIEATAREKNLTLEKRMPDNFPSLLADKELLQGAIINILGNAVKYTPEHGKITFAITNGGEAATFEVIDTGYGIAQEDLPRVFEKFYRSKSKEISAQNGSGLGLAITAEIVRLHGGQIDIKSQLGAGTHVTIRIPKEEHYLGQA